MEIDAIQSGRAAVGAAHQARELDPERGPILVARTGLPPLSSLTGSGAPQDDLLRAALRERAVLRNLDPVLAQPEQALHAVALGQQTGALREPEEERARREASSVGMPNGEESTRLREDRARSRFSQTQAVEASSTDDLVAHFAASLAGRQASDSS